MIFFLPEWLLLLGALLLSFSSSPSTTEIDRMTPLERAVYAGTVVGDDVRRDGVRLPARFYTPEPQPLPEPYSLRWRMGAGVPEMTILGFDWPAARPGWYLNWTLGIIGLQGIPQTVDEMRLEAVGQEVAAGMEYVPVLRSPGGEFFFSEEIITQVAANHPGRTWIIGNEPDNRSQDWATPEQYAAAYHRGYQAIKAGDPTALVGGGSLSQVTPLRLQYLDAVWDSYLTQFGVPMPMDVWTMHAFILREEAGVWGVGVPPGLDPAIRQGQLWTVADHDDVGIVEEQVRLMRQWMANHGQQDKPLWVSEYGILLSERFGFTPDVISGFMGRSFELFDRLRDEQTGYPADDYRLVQRWLWFSTNFPEFSSGDLFDAQGQPTLLMETMADYLDAESESSASRAGE